VENDIFDTAIEDGRAEGEAIGLKKGEAIGMEKGRAEGIEKGKLETAKMMKTEGIPVDTICKCTGLTAKQVKEL